MPPVMILCGGKGTRLRDVTELLPKPMVPIGEQPILWHIMKSYAAFGCKRFILCLGYKREVFVDYFMNYHLRTSDATISLGHSPKIKFYGDGVADVDIAALLKTHRAAGREITVTAVHPAARFGEMVTEGDRIVRFEEKPAVAQGYINGGFMVVSRGFLKKYLTDDPQMFFERDPMQKSAEAGDMTIYRHEGFWQCMDTSREYPRASGSAWIQAASTSSSTNCGGRAWHRGQGSGNGVEWWRFLTQRHRGSETQRN